MPEKPTDFESLTFLVDSAFKEGGLFWRRNNVLLAANLAGFAAAFAFVTRSDEAVHWSARLLIGLFGLFLCVLWVLVTKAGQEMNRAWIDQASLLAQRSTEIPQKEVLAALERTPSGRQSRLQAPSATRLMYFLAAGFAIGWVLVALIGKGGILR